MGSNRRVVLAERPRYTFPTAHCFKLGNTDPPEPVDGEVLVRTQWLGIEPYLLGKVKRSSGQAPVQLGDAMEGPAVGVVEATRNPNFSVGDVVTGLWAWQDRAAVRERYIRRLPSELTHTSWAPKPE
jgi:NADPH-dependent curcumin reductase CurA